jgi:DNA-binding response OmpR family regulator
MQKNILLVDDETSLRRSLFLGLKQEGYSVEPCENGVNAIKKLHLYKKNDVELDTVILDVQLPDIDGIKLAKIIRQKYPNTKIIFITGYSDNINTEDIETLSEGRLLEKPFSAKELTTQIEQMIKEQQESVIHPEVQFREKVSDKPEIQTYSAYCLIKVEKDADFFGIFRQLYFDSNVLYCDATRGEYDIFLLIQANSKDDCKNICDNKVKNIPGIKEVEFLEVTNPILDDSLKNVLNVFSIESSTHQQREFHNVVCSYVLVEVEKEKFESVYPTLYFDDNVVYCDYTESNYNMVLLVQGTQFSQIDKLIKNKIAPLDGVLKVKEFPIISIYEM